MLYVVGGPARSGKSTLARRFSEELKIPYFCVDQVLIGLEKGAPGLGITHEQRTLDRAGKMWMILKPMLVNIYKSEPEYFMDGDVLLPEYMAELGQEIEFIKVCYLGYAHSDPQQKLKSIREYTGPNNWMKNLSDDEILDHVNYGIELSEYLEKEAQKYNFKYFDTSSDLLVP